MSGGGMEMLSGAGGQAGRLPFPSKRGRNLDPLPPPPWIVWSHCKKLRAQQQKQPLFPGYLDGINPYLCAFSLNRT
jgi:hypothetical protein